MTRPSKLRAVWDWLTLERLKRANLLFVAAILTVVVWVGVQSQHASNSARESSQSNSETLSILRREFSEQARTDADSRVNNAVLAAAVAGDCSLQRALQRAFDALAEQGVIDRIVVILPPCGG